MVSPTLFVGIGESTNSFQVSPYRRLMNCFVQFKSSSRDSSELIGSKTKSFSFVLLDRVS